MEKYNNWKLKFYTIWAGQAVSLITSAILQMAIIFYITEKTGSAMVLSMASLVGFLPYAVFGPAIGVLVDRHDRKKIMIGADLIIAAAGAVLAIVALYMELPIWMVMGITTRNFWRVVNLKTLNTIKDWFEENVCNKILLKLPPENLSDCEDYDYKLGHPACFTNSIPSADELPEGKYNTPCALIEFVSGSDDVAGKMGTMDIQIFFSVWNTGTHPFDFFGKLREEKKGTFQKDESGWIDVLNFVDIGITTRNFWRVVNHLWQVFGKRLLLKSMTYLLH